MRGAVSVGRFAAGLLCSACLLLGAARVTAETPPAAAEIPAMTLVTLGTGGGPSYREKRAMSSNAVLVGKEIHIVDAGEGLLHQLAAATLSVALRFETPSRTIVFTGDTGPSRRVEALAKGADLLVSEVIDLDRIARQWRENSDADTAYVESLIAHLAEDHLAPEEVGKLAARAGVKAVVLTHLVPGWDEETDPEVYARGVRNHFRGPVHVANDLDRF
jgi:ribonuclease BN (tRNA processing enzyme)